MIVLPTNPSFDLCWRGSMAKFAVHALTTPQERFLEASRQVALVVGATSAEILLFAGGLSWLLLFTHSLAKAAYLGLYWFLAAEVLKVMFAAAIAVRWRRGQAREAA